VTRRAWPAVRHTAGDLGYLPSGGEVGDETELLVCFNCLLAVVRPHPFNGLVRWRPGEGGETGESRPSSTVAPKATEFHDLTAASALERIRQGGAEAVDVGRDAEVGPLDVGASPPFQWRQAGGRKQSCQSSRRPRAP
jgi:hypothetical protein